MSLWFESYLFHHFICSCFFFFNAPATTEIYTLSLHDALPILTSRVELAKLPVLRKSELATRQKEMPPFAGLNATATTRLRRDRKSTRLNSSHMSISYAVFCLKKKKKKQKSQQCQYEQQT